MSDILLRMNASVIRLRHIRDTHPADRIDAVGGGYTVSFVRYGDGAREAVYVARDGEEVDMMDFDRPLIEDERTRFVAALKGGE